MLKMNFPNRSPGNPDSASNGEEDSLAQSPDLIHRLHGEIQEEIEDILESLSSADPEKLDDLDSIRAEAQIRLDLILPELIGHSFTIFGYGFIYDRNEDSSTGQLVQYATGKFTGMELIGDGVCMVFSDYGEDNSQVLAFPPIAIQSLTDLTARAAAKKHEDDARRHFEKLAHDAYYALTDYLNTDPRDTSECRVDLIANAADDLRAELARDPVCATYTDQRIIVDTTGYALRWDDDALPGELVEMDRSTRVSGEFTGFALLEELNSSREPDVNSLCVAVRCYYEEPGLEGTYFIPFAHFTASPKVERSV